MIYMFDKHEVVVVVELAFKTTYPSGGELWDFIRKVIDLLMTKLP
jgi:hypothetical protein